MDWRRKRKLQESKRVCPHRGSAAFCNAGKEAKPRKDNSESVELHATVISELDDSVLPDLLDKRLVRELRTLPRRVADAAVVARLLALVPLLREVVVGEGDPLHDVLH